MLFGASSAACAYAASVGELIAARAVLGIGAAAIFPLSLAVIPVLFTQEERQKAIALIASTTFISFPIGPIVVLALVAVVVLLPESRSEQPPRVDFFGVLLSSAGLTGLTYGFIKVGETSWTNAAALGTVGAGLVVLVSFVWWERLLTRRGASTRPLIELSALRQVGATIGVAILGTQRVRAGDGHDAVGLRRDSARQCDPGFGLPAAAGRRDYGGGSGFWF